MKAIPLAGLTANQSLEHCLKVGEGDTVLIHAAAGGVGSFAVQIAVARGAPVGPEHTVKRLDCISDSPAADRPDSRCIGCRERLPQSAASP